VTDKDADVERAQLILEGRCPECKATLPAHLYECPHHPGRIIMPLIKDIQKIPPIF
jgi:hypothetical protein